MLKKSIVPAAFLFIAACSTTGEPDPSLQAQATPAQILQGTRQPGKSELLLWTGTVQSVQNQRERTLVEISSYPADRQHQPMQDRPASGRFVLEMRGFLEPRQLPVGLAVTATGRYLGLMPYRANGGQYLLPRLMGQRLDTWPARQPVPSRRPDIRWSIGVGSDGSAVGVGIGL